MKSRDIKLNGLVLRKTNFQETSLILDVLTAEFGKIAVIAKGIRSNKSKMSGVLDLLNENEFDLYNKPQSDWYVLKSAVPIQTNLFGITFPQALLMQAAAEILRQIYIPAEDQVPIYDLSLKYLKYITKTQKNGIAVFWRFSLRLLNILGIDLDFNHCVLCKQKKKQYNSFSTKFHGLICSSCYRPALGIAFSSPQELSYILSHIHSIGNLLEDLQISQLTIKQINKIFLDHLQEHYHKIFHLNSLEMYKG